MPDEKVRLDLERERTNEVLQHAGDRYLSLAVAAAIAFHQVHGNTRAIISRADYDDALSIAAAALSRLIPIYTLRDPREGRVAVRTDLVRQRFARGATELRGDDGSAIRELSVTRSEFLSALSLIRRTGLPFSFALSSTSSEVQAAPETKPLREPRTDGS